MFAKLVLLCVLAAFFSSASAQYLYSGYAGVYSPYYAGYYGYGYPAAYAYWGSNKGAPSGPAAAPQGPSGLTH